MGAARSPHVSEAVASIRHNDGHHKSTQLDAKHVRRLLHADSKFNNLQTYIIYEISKLTFDLLDILIFHQSFFLIFFKDMFLKIWTHLLVPWACYFLASFAYLSPTVVHKNTNRIFCIFLLRLVQQYHSYLRGIKYFSLKMMYKLELLGLKRSTLHFRRVKDRVCATLHHEGNPDDIFGSPVCFR